MALQQIFSRVGKSLSDLVLNDPLEEENFNADRVTTNVGQGTVSVDQQSLTALKVGAYVPERYKASHVREASVENVAEKYYQIAHWSWDASKDVFSYLQTSHGGSTVCVEWLLFQADHAVSGLVRYHRFARFGLDCIFQVNAHNFLAGGLIVGLCPGSIENANISGLLCFPSGIINLGSNNCCRIIVPWVSTRAYRDMKKEPFDVWNAFVAVISKLQGSATSGNNASITLMARFVDFEAVGISPEFTMGPQTVKMSPGSFVFSNASGTQCAPEFDFSFGSESFPKDDSVAGELELNDFKSWTSVPGICGHISFSQSKETGKLLGIIPVTPTFYTQHEHGGNNMTPPLTTVAQLFSFWKGNITYTFECFPTKFHSGRILVSFIPGREIDHGDGLKRITLRQATSGICAIMDIGGVETSLKFKVPFVSPTIYKTTGTHSSTLFESCAVGHILVFVYNQLSCPNTVPNNVDILIWMHSDDMEFFGPRFARLARTDALSINAGEDQVPVVEDDQSGGVEEVKEPNASGVVEDPLSRDTQAFSYQIVSPGKPLHSKRHMSFKEFLKRPMYYFTKTLSKNNIAYVFPLRLRWHKNTEESKRDQEPCGTLQLLTSMAHLYRGPLVVHLLFEGAASCDVIVNWIPPGAQHGELFLETQTTATPVDFAAQGFLQFHTDFTRAVSIKVPWCTNLSAISGCTRFAGTKSNRDGGDDIHSYIRVCFMNYIHSSDKPLRMMVYVSFPPEGQWLCRRAPMSETNLLESTVSVFPRTLTEDVFRDRSDVYDEDNEFEADV